MSFRSVAIILVIFALGIVFQAMAPGLTAPVLSRVGIGSA